MAPTIPFGHPTALTAGDTWQWRIAFADYPVSDGYVLSYALVSRSDATQAPLAWDAGYVTDDGAEYTVTIPASVTDDLGAGAYLLTALLTLGSTRTSVPAGTLLVAADPATAAAGDGLTHAEKVLGYIEAVIEGRATADVESYQINGRALVRTPMETLLKMRSRLRNAVWRERNPGKTLPGYAVSFCG